MPEPFTVPAWVLGLGVLFSTFGPGVAAFFFTRWLKQKDDVEKKAKDTEAGKLDEVLTGVKKLENDFHELKNRLSASDALQNQLKGAQEKIEERLNGIGTTYGRRLGDLEAKVERLDERTRNDSQGPRRRR